MQRDKKTNKHNNFSGLSWERVGVKFVGAQICLCVVFLLQKKRTHKQNSHEISGRGQTGLGIIPGVIPEQSRENFVYVFSCSLFFPAP